MSTEINQKGRVEFQKGEANGVRCGMELKTSQEGEIKVKARMNKAWQRSK